MKLGLIFVFAYFFHVESAKSETAVVPVFLGNQIILMPQGLCSTKTGSNGFENQHCLKDLSKSRFRIYGDIGHLTGSNSAGDLEPTKK